MKKKTLWRVLVVIMTLVLTVGILAACGKKTDGGGTTGGDTPKPDDNTPVTVSTSKQKQTAFFNTMFESANEIGGTAVDLSEGHNLSLNVGLSLTLDLSGSKLPLVVSAKGLIDRTNVRVTSFTVDEGVVKNSVKTWSGKWVWTGDYIAYDESKHAGWERFKLDGESYVADNDGALVKNIVAYDSTKEAHKAETAVRYFGNTFALTADNATVLDIGITTSGVQSLRVYYDVEDTNDDGDARGILYITLAGNKFKVDLNDTAAYDSGSTKKIEDVVFNLIESKILKNDTIKAVISSFGEKFDLNNLLSGMILPLLEDSLKIPDDQTLGDVLLANTTPLFGTTTVSGLVVKLFGSEANVREYLGATLNIKNVINQVNTMIFDDPEWYTWNGSSYIKKSDYYDSLIKDKYNQKLKASINLGGSLINSLVKPISFLAGEGSYITLGFEKDAGTETIGKMDEFYLDLCLAGINGSKYLGISLAIDDLAFGKTADDVSFTALSDTDKAAYGAFTFDAGAELHFDEDVMSIVFHRSEEIAAAEGYDSNTDNGYEIVLGSDNGGTTLVGTDGKTVYVPSTLKIEMKGALDFASPAGTKVVLNVIAENYNAGADFVIATAQLYQAKNTDTALTADIKVYDTQVLPYIMNLIAYQCNMYGNNGNTVGSQGFTKYNGHWGWWHEGYELISLDYGFTAVEKTAEITTGTYYSKGTNVYTKITESDLAGIAVGTTIYQLKDNMVVFKDYSNYVEVCAGADYGNTKLYKKNADGSYVEAADGNYVCEAVYENADTKDSITELYNSKGKVCYASSEAMDNFFTTGELRITGLNLYNLIFNDYTKTQLVMDEYWYLGVKGYEQKAAAAEVQSSGKFDWIAAFLLNPSKNYGALSAVQKLLGYSKTNGALTIGGDDVMDVLFGATGIFTHDNKDNIPVSVYSAIGYLANKDTDILSAWKWVENNIALLSQRGIKFNDSTPVMRFDRADGVDSLGETLLAEWKTATATRKTAIEKELLADGYRLVKVNGDANDAVLYPAVLADNEVNDWASSWNGATGAAAETYKALLEKNGFVIETIEASEYNANKGNFGYYSKTKSGEGGTVTYYAKLTSKSTATLTTEWITADKAGNSETASNLKLALLRRGLAARKYQDSDKVWQYYTEKVFADESIIADADATVKIYTEKSAKVITKAGIRLDITFCDVDCYLDLYMSFNPSTVTVAEDGTITIEGVNNFGSLLGNDVYKVW